MKTHRKNYLSQIVLALIFSCLCISNVLSQVDPRAPIVEFSANPTTYCLGTQVTFFDGTSNVLYPANYYWDFGYGASSSSTTGSGTHIVTYSSPGLKTVTLTVEVPEIETSVTMTKTDYITVYPNTSVTLSSAANTTDQAVCENTPITDIEYSVKGGPLSAPVYGLPTGLNASDDHGVVKIFGTPFYAGTYDYEVRAIGLCGNESSYGRITVYPTPIISDEKTDWTNTSVCSGSSKQLSYTGSPAAVDPWLSNNQAVATVDNNGIVTGISPGTSLITYKDSYGCSNTSTLTVKPLPAAPPVQFNNLVQAGGRMFLCANPEDYYTSYTWTGPANFTSTQSCPNYFGEATEEMQGIYRVTATVDGCTGPAADAEVMVNYPPVITEGESVEVSCNEDTMLDPSALTLNAIDPDGDALLWSVSSGPFSGEASLIGTGTSRAISYTPSSNFNGYDLFYVTVSDGSGGSDYIAVTVKVNAVNDAPVVAAPLSDQVLDEHFGTRTIDLSGVFTDPDNDPLTLTVVSSDESVVSASVAGTTLTLTEAGAGVSNITVTANDGHLSAQNVFLVTVNKVQASLATISTSGISLITMISAQCGGNVTSDGGAPVTARGVCWSTNPGPTVDGTEKTTDGSGTGTYSSLVTGLSAGTTYYLRSYATNSSGTAYGNEIVFKTYSPDAITDNDGNYYNKVTIGSQVWMAENLRTATPDSWVYPGAGEEYGRLYSWNAAMSACPVGWHLPSDYEWMTMISYVGLSDVNGSSLPLRETGFSHWDIHSLAGTNSTGFTALPGGDCYNGSDFEGIGFWGTWWSSQEAQDFGIVWGWANVSLGTSSKSAGLSVRCIQNSPPVVTTIHVSSITSSTAFCDKHMDEEGGSSVTDWGVCWSTSENPTVDLNTKTSDGIGSITGLAAGTTYHVRAYATNSVGTGYGEDLVFTTLKDYQLEYISGGNQTYSGGSMLLPMVFKIKNVTDNIYVTDLVAEKLSLNAIAATGYQDSGFNNNNDYCGNGDNSCYGGFYYVETNTGQSYILSIIITLMQDNQYLSDFTIKENINGGVLLPSVSTNSISGITTTSAISGGSIVTDGGGIITESGICWATITNPTIDDSKTVSGAGTGSYISNLSGLMEGTTYFVRAFATNSAGTAYGNEISFKTYNNDATQDIDGNYYNTVTIGSQVWMAENLKTTRYNDGTAIPLVTDNAAWGALTTPGYCWYNNDEATYKDQYGALYNWYVVNAESNGGKNACPAGWYVPNDADWSILTTYLGGESVAGGKLKESGTVHWQSPNSEATNEFLFSALPGGRRVGNGPIDGLGAFSAIGYDGSWWSATEFSSNWSYYRNIQNQAADVYRAIFDKPFGFSVRCLQGEAASSPVLSTSAVSGITQTLATAGGTITSDGGAPVTAHGVCWSTSPNPTIELDSKTMDGTGNGNFTSSITELTAGTTYHVRAYATNSAGTGYGEDIVFTTLKVYQLEYISGNNQTYNGAGMPLPIVFKIKNITDDLYVTNLAAENLSITATALTGNLETEFNNGNNYCGNGDNGCYGGYYYVDPNTGDPYTLTISVTLKNDNQELSAFTITENITGAIVLPAVTTNSISGITTTSAISGGSIVTDGGGNITERGICWATMSNPNINDSKAVSVAGTGSYISNLSGLIEGTTYFVRAFATNSAGTAYGNEISFKTYNNGATQDIDGNYYNTVTIGSQVWMTQNLKTTRFNDGSNITLADPASSLENITDPVYCWYENNPDVYKETYGALYNWYAANSNKLCPAGWHVPSDAEWTTLTDYLGGLDIAGSKLKEAGNNHWVIGNSDATNESGFTALPGGNRGDAYYSLGTAGYWWTSTEGDLAYTGWHRNMGSWDGKVGRYFSNKYFAWSVRCLQGEAATLPILSTSAASSMRQTLATAGGTITSDGGAPVTTRGVCWSTSTNPTVDLSTKTQDGSGTGSFTSTLSGLSSGTLYYIRAYATNSTGTAYGNEFSFKTYNSDAIIDIDGNYYNTVTIGSQVWLAENLRTSHYNDGTPVPLITDNATWTNSAAPGYCWYNNDQTANKDIYGALYNWYIVDALSNGSKNVCPAGWSVPTDSEWSTLTTFLGGEAAAGGKLKETGFSHWTNPNTDATNETGFTALPGGARKPDGPFDFIGGDGHWWCTSLFSADNAWLRYIDTYGGIVARINADKNYGLSIRCLKSNVPSNTHFVPVWWPGNGMDHMNLYALTATLDNVALQPGDEIGIFDGDICVGMGVLSSVLTGSNYLACTVSRDDPDTPAKDGYTPGNTVSFKIWDSSTDAEVSNVQAVYVSGSGIYSAGATSTFNLSAITSVAQSTNLASGWNILSFAVKPDNMSMMAIVSPLKSAGILIKVQDEKGNAIERLPDPIGWVDYIGQMSLSEGYKIKVSANTPLNISGQPLGTLLNVSLDAGWNIMGYPFMSSQPALAAFEPLISAGSLLKVQNEQGNAIEKLPDPIGWIDNIHNLLPGKGYKVKTTINTSLAINNAGKGDFQSYEAASIRPAHFKPVFPGNGLDQMNIYLKNPTLEGVGLKVGDEIGVFDGSRCVGAIIVADASQGYISVIVSSDDPTTKEKDGFTDGDAFDFRLWDNQAGLELKAKNTEPQKGFSNIFEKSATSVIKVDFEKESYTILGDAYPNPTTDKTTFTFQLATESQVQLGIYNINGSLIKLLFDQKMPGGTHKIEWDNKAANGTKASSGIYFYRLKLNNFLQTKRLVIH